MSAGEVSVLAPNDCRTFHLDTDLSPTDLRATLQDLGLGRAGEDDRHAMLDIDRVHALASAAADEPGWEADWSAMISYAESKGWADAEHGVVRAHVEFRDGSGTDG